MRRHGSIRMNGYLAIAGAAAAVWLSSPSFVVPSPADSHEIRLRNSATLGRSTLPGPMSARPSQRDTTGARSNVDSEGSLFGFLLKSAAAAGCAFAASAALRRSQQKRSPGTVVMRMSPSHRPKQKAMRRLEPFGAMPAWSRKPLMKRRLIQPWRKKPKRRISAYGRNLIERQRVRFHYNIKLTNLKKYAVESLKKGIEWPVDHLLQTLESRIDNFCWRVGIAPTMAAARFLIREGHFQYQYGSMPDFCTINIPNMRLKVGTKLRVRPRKSSQNHCRIAQEEASGIEIPNHITWDRETMEGSYDDICDIREIGIHVNENALLRNFTGSQQGVRRFHYRYFEGTNKIIPNRFNGGRPRPTPENIINMKKGLGLNPRGRKRPPCLWGRKMPLNNPYESRRNVRKLPF